MLPLARAVLSASPPAAASPAPEVIRDIAPPIDIFPYPLWMVIVALALALVVLALALWPLIRALRRRPPPIPPSPRAVALQALENLRTAAPALDPHAFSVAVSEVLRSYIGAAYGLHATRQTSPEFLAGIAQSPAFSETDRAQLATFLERCDLIKFARIDATNADSAELLGSAITFVQGGRP